MESHRLSLRMQSMDHERQKAEIRMPMHTASAMWTKMEQSRLLAWITRFCLGKSCFLRLWLEVIQPMFLSFSPSIRLFSSISSEFYRSSRSYFNDRRYSLKVCFPSFMSLSCSKFEQLPLLTPTISLSYILSFLAEFERRSSWPLSLGVRPRVNYLLSVILSQCLSV